MAGGMREQRLQRLQAVLQGMFESPTPRIGSRQPIDNTPVWVTPEITQEGFATGRLSAELAPGAASNRSWLTQEGLEKMRLMLDSGCYAVRYPEHGALPVVVSLIDSGREAEALEVLTALRPWMNKLQFYPEPRDSAPPTSALVNLLTVKEVAAHVEAQALRPTPPAAEAFKRAVTVLRPLYHELVSLFLETAEAWPCQSAPFPAEAWPCQNWPEGWHERGTELSGRYAVLTGIEHEGAEQEKKQQKKHDSFWEALEQRRASRVNQKRTPPASRRKLERGNMARLYAYLRIILKQGQDALTGRDVGFIRTIIVDFVRKYGGPPGSEGFAAVSPKFLPTRFGHSAAYAPALLARLRQVPEQDGGFVSAQALGFEVLGGPADEPLIAPISAEEADSIAQPMHVRAGDALPKGLARYALKCLTAPLDRLIELGVVTSLEMLCAFVPQLAAETAPIADPAVRQLYMQVYKAFRLGRRTLLLLNLERQVHLSELPWARAMECFKGDGGGTAAREALLLLARTALVRFPGEGVPNKLQHDLRALMEQAGIPQEHPLLEGLAADIFMDRFSKKFGIGAKAAARFVRAEAGLYERFWGLGAVYDKLLSAEGDRLVEAGDLGRLISSTYAGTRGVYKGESGYARHSEMAASHQKIQWQQIVCAGNMVTLLEGFGLRQTLSVDDVRGMAMGALRVAQSFTAQAAWTQSWKGQLRCKTQATTALLQGTLLLALLPPAVQAATIEEAMEMALARAEGTAKLGAPQPQFSDVLQELMGLVG